jgi:hypothetical protein
MGKFTLENRVLLCECLVILLQFSQDFLCAAYEEVYIRAQSPIMWMFMLIVMRLWGVAFAMICISSIHIGGHGPKLTSYLQTSVYLNRHVNAKCRCWSIGSQHFYVQSSPLWCKDLGVLCTLSVKRVWTFCLMAVMQVLQVYNWSWFLRLQFHWMHILMTFHLDDLSGNQMWLHYKRSRLKLACVVTVDTTCLCNVDRLFSLVWWNKSLVFRCIVVQLFVPIFAMDVEKWVNCMQERRLLWDFCINYTTT